MSASERAALTPPEPKIRCSLSCPTLIALEVVLRLNLKEDSMKNNLFAVRPARHMRCAWFPTGDTKKPLQCVWIEATSAAPLAETKGTGLCR